MDDNTQNTQPGQPMATPGDLNPQPPVGGMPVQNPMVPPTPGMGNPAEEPQTPPMGEPAPAPVIPEPTDLPGSSEPVLGDVPETPAVPGDANPTPSNMEENGEKAPAF